MASLCGCESVVKRSLDSSEPGTLRVLVATRRKRTAAKDRDWDKVSPLWLQDGGRCRYPSFGSTLDLLDESHQQDISPSDNPFIR